MEDLARTDAQRAADAMDEIFRAAADAHAAAIGGSRIVTDIVIDHHTFERELRRLAGQRTAHGDVPLDPDGTTDGDGDGDGDRRPDRSTGRLGFRSSTLDGHPVDPSDVVAEALLGHVRRVVIGADSVIIDLGRTQRCFTGPAALAVKLRDEQCAWPGCHLPTSQCQSDHLMAWATGGRTDPGNGAPLCGHHNRTKELGYRIERDDLGRLHTYRPDGTELT